jgi:hypothetical protein
VACWKLLKLECRVVLCPRPCTNEDPLVVVVVDVAMPPGVVVVVGKAGAQIEEVVIVVAMPPGVVVVVVKTGAQIEEVVIVVLVQARVVAMPPGVVVVVVQARLACPDGP